MGDTYIQLIIHIIFAVKGKESLITKEVQEKLYPYISGIILGKDCKPIIINGTLDHIHILLGMSTSISISDLVKSIKLSSSKYLNDLKISKFEFNWQNGYGAFSVSKSQMDKVYKYIENQEKHHKVKTFEMEYIDFLKKYEIEFSKKYLFDFYNE